MTADLITAGSSHRSLRDVSGSAAVVVEMLTKRYGGRAAVDNLSFAIPTGTVAGLIGPNGAGKSTLMAMLLGLIRPTSGTGSVLGEPLGRTADYLNRVGALIESPAFHPAVSGIDNLRSLAVLGSRAQTNIPDLIELVGLAGRGDDRVGSYSMGMKQRLGIAASLLGDPELIILDEPNNGLDPVGMQDVRRLIGETADGGRTILVSSHLLGELELVCDWLI
ncbi:MAG: ABC transporter ATP-binding protein, partial [Ilumatobacteraceae bacterium]